MQFVRDGGIAREAGLRPGDQILSCNGLDFTNVSFNEVSYDKKTLTVVFFKHFTHCKTKRVEDLVALISSSSSLTLPLTS